jgi:hypothetical protein
MRGRVAVKVLFCRGCRSVRTGEDGPRMCGHSISTIGKAVGKIGNTAALLSRMMREGTGPNRSTYVLRRLNLRLRLR